MSSTDMLSPNALRRANIARNDEMLRLLGFGVSTMVHKAVVVAEKEPAKDGRSAPAKSPKRVNANMWEQDETETEEARGESLRALLSSCPERREELRVAWHYLSEDCPNSPPLLINGPSGCGKSFIAESVTFKHSAKKCGTVNCSSYSTSRQFMRALWHSILPVIHFHEGTEPPSVQTLVDSGSSKSHKEQQSIFSKVPATFSDFVCQLQDRVRHYYARFHAVLVLDKADALGDLEKGLKERLFKLSDFAHPNIKVIAIGSTQTRCVPGLLLSLQQYTRQESKTLAERFLVDALKSKASSGEVCDREGRVDVHTPEGRLQFATALVSYAVPLLCALTTHLSEILAACEELACILLQPVHGFTAPIRPLPRLGGSGSGKCEGDRKPSGDSLFDAASPSQKRKKAGAATVLPQSKISSLVAELLNLPVAHVSAQGKHKDEAARGGVTMGSKRARGVLSPARIVKRGQVKVEKREDDWPQHTDLECFSQIIDVATLRGAKSCKQLPQSRKYLLLASYLSGANPKETDDYVFAMRKKGRRKKERAGTDTSVEVHGARPFTLERLLSIFSQVSIICELQGLDKGKSLESLMNEEDEDITIDPAKVAKTIETRYGDTQLFAAVNDLERQQYLVKAPNWSLDMPLYFSCVSPSMALEIAGLVKFDVQAYTVH